jgi:multidrug efflux pump subunit AcrA (membrane-fusion protein)
MDKARYLKTAGGHLPKPYVMIIFVALVGFSLLAGCGAGNSVDEVEFLVPVSVSDVGTADVEDRIVATGTLRASRMVSLEVETGGVLEFAKNSEGRRFGEGDRVKAGDCEDYGGGCPVGRPY